MPAPRWLARANRRLTNRVLGRVAPRLPGFGVVIHTGRRTGRQYRTPVNVFRHGQAYVVALTYGSGAEWVRNVLASSGCALQTRGRTVELVGPRIVHDPHQRMVPAPVRVPLRLLDVTEFLELWPGQRGPAQEQQEQRRQDNMYAVVRDNQYDPARLAQGQAQLDEFQALHDRQVGALGTLVVDAGNDRWITINVWDSEEHAAAALPGLIPQVQRLIEPQLARPSQLIAAGRVRVNTLTPHQAG
jgi:deazaflavin-dependent oxidoreductase (nitroreductase family)